jgi:CRP/FNR family cyclic AMP-dependent transcriptional regulator
MPVDAAALADVPFFKMLCDTDLEDLARVVECIYLPAGATLFQEGDPGDALYIVRKGAVEIHVHDTTGQKIVLTVVRENEFFGEIAVIDRAPRSATALAVEDSELIELDRKDLLLLFQRRPDTALHMLAAIGAMTRKADGLLKTRVSRNVNVEVEEKLTVLQRTADWIAWFSGSMPFLFINAIWFFVWIVLNIVPEHIFHVEHFDPYPFGFLTMVVSLEAIFLSIFVLVSQNRQAEKDRVRADIEYEVNVKAELEIAHLHEKTDRLQTTMLERFARLEKKLTKPARLG